MEELFISQLSTVSIGHNDVIKLGGVDMHVGGGGLDIEAIRLVLGKTFLISRSESNPINCAIISSSRSVPDIVYSSTLRISDVQMTAKVISKLRMNFEILSLFAVGSSTTNALSSYEKYC